MGRRKPGALLTPAAFRNDEHAPPARSAGRFGVPSGLCHIDARSESPAGSTLNRPDAMIVILELIALGVFALIAISVWRTIRGPRREPHYTGALPTPDDAKIPLPELSPGKAAAEALRAFENARAELKARYPAIFAMFGGYLNRHTIAEHGGIEGAVREMIADWAPRREEAMRELAKLLAENETEEEIRAVVMASSDAEFDQEGNRAWLTWLLGRFNAL